MKIKHILIRVLPYVALFIIASVITSIIINRQVGLDSYSDADAVYPIIYLNRDGELINSIYGDAGEDDGVNNRNWIYPMNSDCIVKLEIKKSGNNIQNIEYELSESVNGNTLTTGKLDKWEDSGDTIKADLDFSTSISDNREYILKLKLGTKSGDAYYHTRVSHPETRDFIEALSFAKEFQGYTYDKKSDEKISIHLENRADVDDTNLAKVSIGSNYDNITWAGMNPKQYTSAVYSFAEINSSFTAISAEYIASAVQGSKTNLYKVKEYYRLRKANDVIYLLDFNRDLEQIFDMENASAEDGKMLLGISSEDNDVKLSESGSALAFVRNGVLYSFNTHNNKLIQVFAFSTAEDIEAGSFNQNYKIKIIKVAESGNIEFAVIGQMNSGEHEGKNGIAIYSYNSQNNTSNEEVFLSMKENGQVVTHRIGGVLYLNEKNQLYVTYNNALYKIGLDNKESEIIAANLPEGVYTASQDGHLIAISNSSNPYDVTEIRILNLDSEKEYTINAESGEKVLPIGFLENDIVYAVAKDSNITKDAVGNTSFLMSKIIIANEQEILKEYGQKGYLITNASIDGNRIIMKRIDATTHKEAADDSIVSISGQNMPGNDVKMVSISGFKNQEAYIFADPGKAPSKIKTEKAQMSKKKDNIVENVFNQTQSKEYYVYSAGRLRYVADSTAEAINMADKYSGVVIEANGEYLWIKGLKAMENELTGYQLNEKDLSSYSCCLNMMLKMQGINVDTKKMLDEGKKPVEILEEYSREKVVNLSGCSLDCALNFISQGAPVLAATQDNKAMLIIGYDIYNIKVVSPADGYVFKIALDDARNRFAEAGNLFLTYKK